jgi:hypothetical protein
MTRTVTILAALAAAMAAAAALANDGVAERTAGGLVIRPTDQIDMVSEDLYVSADRIRVRYVFRNRTPRDVRVTVAFPMPDRDFGELRYEGANYPADFATRVDGRPVRLQVERQAIARGVDQSALLQRLGLPVLAEDTLSAVDEAAGRLTAEQRRRLEALGLIESSEYDAGQGLRTHWEPIWTLKETWYWEQVFPAGRDLVVEHAYTPGAGASIGSELAFRELRGSPGVRAMIDRYCVDRAFLAAIDRMSARSTEEEPVLLGERTIGYILTTGAGWRSPIGDFRLVVDKGRPDNIVSFCGTGLRRISPTQFEMRRRNWRPDRDLAVLIVSPNREAE